MKKDFFLLLILLATLSCTSCVSNTDPEDLFDVPHNTLQGPFNDTNTELKHSDELPLSVPYQYGNMQRYGAVGGFMRYENQILFLKLKSDSDQSHIGKNLLYTLNPATGKVSLLCKDASCSHDSCVSSGIFGNVEQYGGKIYAQGLGGEILELTDNGFEKVVNGRVDIFWHADDDLYAVTKDSSLITFEDGSKEPKIIVDEYSTMQGVVVDHWLYGYWRDITRVDLDAQTPKVETVVRGAYGMVDVDNKQIYYIDEKSGILYRCELDGTGVLQLTDRPVLIPSLNFDDDYLYFRFWDMKEARLEGCNALYRMAKDRPGEMELLVEIPGDRVISYIYTVPGYDQLIVDVIIPAGDGGDQNETDELWLIAKDGSSACALEMPEF